MINEIIKAKNVILEDKNQKSIILIDHKLSFPLFEGAPNEYFFTTYNRTAEELYICKYIDNNSYLIITKVIFKDAYDEDKLKREFAEDATNNIPIGLYSYIQRYMSDQIEYMKLQREYYKNVRC